jgi:REP element-mobilizing transposase RayT
MKFAAEATKRRVLIGSYLVMPDHIHLFAAFSPQSPPPSKVDEGFEGQFVKSS